MAHIKLFSLVAVLLLLQLDRTGAQQNCINTCTDSANVLTQLKSCSGCGTDDWSCFCQCRQYTDALLSCAEQYCTGTDVINSIVSFCADQNVTLSYNSTTLFPLSSSTSSTTSAASSSSTTTSSNSFSATDASDVSAYLAAAVPASAQTESSAACFVNTPYSYYSTPTWYSSLPTQVQTYYSSVNQGNTAACTLSPSQAAALANSNSGSNSNSNSNSHRSGLSAGAIAGIVIGAVLAALLLAALLWCCLRRRRRSRRNAAVARSMENGPHRGFNGPVGSQAPYMNEKKGPIGSGVPVSGHAVPAAGGGVFGAGHEQNQPNGYSTTTTTRTTIRSKPRNSGYTNPSSQPPRPPPQPIPNHSLAHQNGPPQSTPQNTVGRRAF